MTRRWRILSFGSAGLLVILGSVLAAVLGGGAGEIAAMTLIGLGLVMATGLVFLEVGFSEDREREREPERKREGEREPDSKQEGNRGRGRIRRVKRPVIERSRGHRRRLR
jgi:hypothetical protein